ncbi:uncharacterized protein LOC124298143 [Neodiprion virginianus]|uniref:uncharacterized protein LOC124298143 n=1 Tax=Neodiprion virginianus TaxID=2961670 RepID=UPI001EE6978E|nr:uncharacterized protein LOC124298143 [Neodiprion virginianus]
MGKFAVVLCLLAIVYGTSCSEADITKIVTRMILKVDREIIAIYNAQSAMDDELDYVKSNASAIESTVNGTVVGMVSKYEAQWNTLVSSTSVDYDSCDVSWSNEYTKADALVDEICDCIECYVSSAESSCQTFSDYVDEAADFLLLKLRKIAAADDESIFNFYTDVTGAGSNITHEALLLNTVAAMENKFAKTSSDFSYKVFNCLNATAVVNFATAVKDYYIDAETCLTGLESSST